MLHGDIRNCAAQGTYDGGHSCNMDHTLILNGLKKQC